MNRFALILFNRKTNFSFGYAMRLARIEIRYGGCCFNLTQIGMIDWKIVCRDAKLVF
jgi:hypothetical protein